MRLEANTNLILAIAFELIVRVIGIVVRSPRYALFSRIRFIFVIVGAIVGNEIEKWREWRERRQSNKRRKKERRKKRNLKRNGNFRMPLISHRWH